MNHNINRLLFCFSLVSLLVCNISCKKYLEIKPDKSLAIPRSVKELQGLLNLETNNNEFPLGGQFSDDNVYSPYSVWNTIFFVEDKDAYIWNSTNDFSKDYARAYERISVVNVVLDEIDKINDPISTIDEYNMARGSAFFYRAINFYELAQLFSPQYSNATASSGLGIPLKLTSAIEEPTKRSTVQQTYDRIITDAKNSLGFLPAVPGSTPSYKMRPSKAAAYGLLARCYLMMSDYISAEKYSDSCLNLYNSLLNYNNSPVVVSSTNPFPSFNDEVIFHTVARNPSSLTRLRIDTTLFNSYVVDDLRKTAFFRINADGTYNFKGNYNQAGNRNLFCGIAVDEIYLIKAECKARNGQVSEAMNVLNTLMITRWKNGFFTPFNASSADQALTIILQERRKELCFRPSLEWSDLRRLNLDSRFSKTVTRILNGQTYLLPTNDNRYTFLIPQSVINISGIQQNPR